MKHKIVMGSILFLIIILAFTLYKNIEGFSGLYDLSTPGTFPKSVNQAILNDYPLIKKNETSTNNYNQIWWHYPVFKLGSYKQLTNNLKYYDNPDNGTCSPADFCGALYKNKKDTTTNIILPLPPVQEGPGVRVGYFRSEA
jgi:hypothetical protein